jgi:hypothetical protein
MADEYPKDPGAVLDWVFDWTRWLQEGETITASSFSASAGITITDEDIANTYTTVWLSGGAQKVYSLTNTITTNQNRTDRRTITIKVKER